MDTNVKTSISKQGFEVHSMQKKILGNIYEPKVALEDKVYPETYYRHQPWSVIVDKTLANIKAHGLQIVGWSLTKEQQLMKLNLGIDVKPQLVKINA